LREKQPREIKGENLAVLKIYRSISLAYERGKT
jgi:hypothetical protein